MRRAMTRGRMRAATAAGCVLAAAMSGCGGAAAHQPTPRTRATARPTPKPTPRVWDGPTLQAAALAGGAMPAPLKADPDSKQGNGQRTCDQVRKDTPSGLQGSLTDDACLAGFRRSWLSHAPDGVAFVELTSFATPAGAEDFAASLSSYLQLSGTPPQPVPDIAPDAMEFTTQGPGGQGWGIVAARDGVVMELAAGGANLTQLQVEQLAVDQLRRL